MNMQLRGIGRIALLAIAVAVLIGIAGRSASAEPIDINSGPATVARGLCVGSGGDWNITNNVFFCTYPGGHGWACDMDTNPVVCWNFLTAPTGGDKRQHRRNANWRRAGSAFDRRAGQWRGGPGADRERADWVGYDWIHDIGPAER